MNVIGDRYNILTKLGQGGSGITYAALDKQTNRKVALKALSLTGLDDWKKIELFEREAKILQQLNHPAIPQYLDYFQIETEDDVYFYIVQQLAPGKSLVHLISEGWQPEQATVKNIAQQILEILVYLQQLTPPVIHRDIKPQNIIYQPDTGKLSLVDFGAVQDTYHHTVMGSTVVGTYGYMAPEQYRGGAVLSTDLYGLACTLLFLLTGESPAELPQKKLKLDFRNSLKIEPFFANWIDKCIEPNIERRFLLAEAALLVFQEKRTIEEYEKTGIFKPRNSEIAINKVKEQLIIHIPPPYQRKRVNRWFYFWLFWGGLSILNRLAIFVSVIWLGKIYIIIWLYNIILNYQKKSCMKIIEYGVLILCLITIKSGYISSIPVVSMCLVIIDTILEVILKCNIIQQLIVRTKITFYKQKADYFMVEQKVLKFWHKEKYRLENISLPKAFLTKGEKIWLQAEIDKYLSSR